MPQGGEKIGVIGLGTASIGGTPQEEAVETIRYAFENGVNYVDLAAGHAEAFPYVGAAAEGLREKLYFQIHFGAPQGHGRSSGRSQITTP